jgi:energy-converting hydrogenase Eha subunit B
MTAGTMPVVPRGNFVVSGDAAASGFGNDSLIYGRLSLGFVASLIVFVGLAYVWTRNIQGGG